MWELSFTLHLIGYKFLATPLQLLNHYSGVEVDIMSV